MSQQLFKVYLQSIQHTFKDLPKGNFYWRFHKRDINKIVTTPCPVDSPTKETEIQLFKELRAQIGVREDFVCPQCPHHAKCQKAFQQAEGGNMQTLLLPNLSKFLETISTHQMNLQNDQKSFWLSSTRVLDTFHSILIDFQLNQNKLNEQFLSDIAQVSENESIHQQEPSKRPNKYTKKADFLEDQNTQPKKEGRRPETEEFDNDNKHQGKRYNYNDNSESSSRYEKFNRYDKGDKYTNKYDRSDQFNKRDRFDRYDNQYKQDRHFDQDKYNDSGRYDKYANKQDKYERYDNKDRYNRKDRSQKYDREANGDQFRENRSFDKYEDRSQRYDRSERRDKFDRNDRSERSFKGDRFERRNTDYSEESKETSRNYKGRRDDFQDNEKSHYENDRFQKNNKQTKVKEEEDFNTFVKQREQYLKEKEDNFEGDKKQYQNKKDVKSVQQNDQENLNEINDEETPQGRKVKRSMKFKIQ
ncbi:unnamed protein product [Paramecium primaurelia]|uniref:Uncharacterized protein n=1 Tax=Paramecium primaurelia TaxID=5886 RepID=A0A8S1JZV9_PARPR|nr:unnamed protein product [Paramecium primaurelia]